MQRILLILAAVIFSLPSYAYSDSLPTEDFLAGKVYFSSLSRIDRDPEFNMIYMSLISNFDAGRMHSSSGKIYRSIAALGIVDCRKKLLVTVDHLFHERLFAQGPILEYDLEEPDKLKWLSIKDEIAVEHIYEIVRGYCVDDGN